MITKVALKRNGIICVGHIGERHDKVILANPREDAQEYILGFVDDRGEFYDRKQAGQHAFDCGQISELTDCLLSEDVW
jgi:hypothetical protein